MLVHADVGRIATLQNDVRAGPLGAIGVYLVAAVRLVVVVALLAVEAGVHLGADADAVAFLDEVDLGAGLDYPADDFFAK